MCNVSRSKEHRSVWLVDRDFYWRVKDNKFRELGRGGVGKKKFLCEIKLSFAKITYDGFYIN
jgi:hypothetical protein